MDCNLKTKEDEEESGVGWENKIVFVYVYFQCFCKKICNVVGKQGDDTNNNLIYHGDDMECHMAIRCCDYNQHHDS
jgi:hypothetical protein